MNLLWRFTMINPPFFFWNTTHPPKVQRYEKHYWKKQLCRIYFINYRSRCWKHHAYTSPSLWLRQKHIRNMSAHDGARPQLRTTVFSWVVHHSLSITIKNKLMVNSADQINVQSQLVSHFLNRLFSPAPAVASQVHCDCGYRWSKKMNGWK